MGHPAIKRHLSG